MKDLAGKPLPFLIKATLIIICFLFFKTTFSQKKSTADNRPKTIIEMSIEELKQRYNSELSDLKFNSNQDSLDSLLKKVGKNIEAFFRDLVNISCKEKVQLRNGWAFRNQEFYYVILPPKDGAPWTEERTDNKGQLVTPYLPGFTISKGYAYTCIYLHPDHQKSSFFRYLGREKKKPGAHIIAFAQKPESNDYLAGYVNESRHVSIKFLVQGFIWVDPGSYQVLRIATGMLSPIEILMEQTTDIFYQKVHFDGVQQQFWLPKEINVSWKGRDINSRNQHKYSDFRLFTVDTNYKLDRPQGK
jgi:hypothetical protein